MGHNNVHLLTGWSPCSWFYDDAIALAPFCRFAKFQNWFLWFLVGSRKTYLYFIHQGGGQNEFHKPVEIDKNFVPNNCASCCSEQHYCRQLPHFACVWLNDTCKVWQLEMENTDRLTHIIKLYANCLPSQSPAHTRTNIFYLFSPLGWMFHNFKRKTWKWEEIGIGGRGGEGMGT